MDDRDIASEKIGKLRQKEGRAQIAHQPFVEEGRALGYFAHAGEDRAVGRNIALAAGGGDDHVGVVEDLRLAGNARIGERETGRIDADPLPQLHLALIALFRNLLVEIQRTERMHDIRREALVVVGRRVAALEMTPGRLEPLAKARDKADAGDPHLAAFAHLGSSSVSSFTGRLMRSAHSSMA